MTKQSSWLPRSVRPEYVPALHAVGTGAPCSQKWPGSHALHTCWPESSWYVPASHRSHLAIPTVGAPDPASHGVCTLLPGTA